MSKKNAAQLVRQRTLFYLVKQAIINNDINAVNAAKCLYGRASLTKSQMKNIGSSYGSKRATASDSYVTSQATAEQSSNVSRIIGSNNYLMNSLIIQSTST